MVSVIVGHAFRSVPPVVTFRPWQDRCKGREEIKETPSQDYNVENVQPGSHNCSSITHTWKLKPKGNNDEFITALANYNAQKLLTNLTENCMQYKESPTSKNLMKYFVSLDLLWKVKSLCKLCNYLYTFYQLHVNTSCTF